MKAALGFLRGLFALVVLLAIAAGFAMLAHWGIEYIFHGVNPTVAAAVAVGMLTGLGSVVAIVVQRRYEGRQKREDHLRGRKIDVYSKLLESWFNMFGIGQNRTDEESAAAIDDSASALMQLAPELIAWSSDEVLAQWSRFRRLPTLDPIRAKWSLLEFEEVLKAIRKDLGHSNKNLQSGDLLGLWVNDIDTIVDARVRGVDPDSLLVDSTI